MEGWNRFKQSIVAAVLGFDEQVRKATGGWQWWVRNGIPSPRARAAVALFMAAVIVATGYWVWSAWHSSRLAELASVPRSWPNDRVLPDDVTVEITTTCVDSVLSYVVVLVPPRMDAPATPWQKTDRDRLLTDRLRQRLKAIHLTLVDKTGTPAATYDVAIEEFVRLYSNHAERPVVLEARGTRPCGLVRYARAETLVLGWTERQ